MHHDKGMSFQRARLLEPEGLGDVVSTRELYLEDGDTVFIPAKRNLVTLAGEVMFPTAVAWRGDAGARNPPARSAAWRAAFRLDGNLTGD